MIKPIILIFFVMCIIPISSGLAPDVILPYTNTSAIHRIDYDNIDDEFDIILLSDNIIYSVTNQYIFGYGGVALGEYSHTFIFGDDDKIIEKWIITDGILSKNVNYSMTVYENDVIYTSYYFNYKIFKYTSYTNFITKYNINDNEIEINIKYTDGLNYKTVNTILEMRENQKIVFLYTGGCYQADSIMIQLIEYIKEGNKPKSYYINELNPILRIPYIFLLNNYDENNSLLNVFLLISYILTSVLFWIEVIYKSIFAIYVILILGLIPIVSYINSNNRMDFIYELVNNYKRIIEVHLSLLNWFINIVIKIIDLIPFI